MSKETMSQNIERETPPQEFIGVQGRFLIASEQAFNPKATLAAEKMQMVASFTERGYHQFETASVRELKKVKSHHIRIGDSPEATMRSIAHSNLVKLEQKTSTDWDGFYKRYFKTLDVDVDHPTELTVDDVLKAQDRYFAPDTPHESRVKDMVSDIMAAYQTDGEIDADAIKDNLRNIKNWAAILGPQSSEMVVQLVLAETKLRTDPNFKDKAGENINNLTDPEVKLLEFVSGKNNKQKTEPTELFTGGELPIMKHKEEIQESVRDNDVTIVIGGTGSGKTVGTPRFVRDLLQPGEKFYVTEPTQANTSNIPKYIAELEGVTFGEEIGFEHGDDAKVTDKTDTTFGTERKLVMKMMKDPTLKGYDYVMVDEIHVQSMHTEELVAMLMNAQRLRKERNMKPLKLIAASATVNEEALKRYFGVDKTINVEGRTFPVEHHWASKDYTSEELPREAAITAKKIHNSGQEGDVVIFVSGEADMKATQATLQSQNLENVKIIPLHRGSPEEQKQEVGKTAETGTRRIIIATNFAETGVTINGLKFVINTGEEFEQGIEDVTGLSYVKKIKKSQAAIKQSSGRVGRNAPGDVYHLYTEANFKSRPEYNKPELEKTDLTPLILDYLQMKDFSAPFMSELPKNRQEFAHDNLLRLGAISQEGELTEIGKRMTEIPNVDYHSARMIVEAERQKKGINQIVTIASFGEKSPLPRDPNKREQLLKQFGVKGSDFLTLLNIARAFQANGSSREWAENNGLNYQALAGAEKTRAKIMKSVKRDKSNNERATNEDLQKIIMEGYKDRLMVLNTKTNTYVWHRQKADNINIVIDRDSQAKTKELPKYVVSSSNSRVEDGVRYINLRNVQAVKEEWLQ